MKLTDFDVERYFARYEFSAKYMLSSSDCDGFPMQYVLDQATEAELQQWQNLTLGYTESGGGHLLREAISNHYQQINPDEILVSSPGEANFILMNLLLTRGDEAICMRPMYQSLYQVAEDLGCKIRFWEPQEKRGQWSFPLETLEALITSKTKLIIVNFPHNPTGYSPSLREYKALIALAEKHNITIFSDEMYRFLTPNAEYQLPSLCDLYEKGVSLWGTAKTFGLAGLRLGWLTSKNTELLHRVECFKDYLSICSSAPSEVLTTIALHHLERFVTPNVEKIKRNITYFAEFQRQHSNLLEFTPPRSGSTAFVKLHLEETAAVFAEKLVRNTGIMLLPSETFHYGTEHMRIGFGRENMPEMLDVLSKYLKAHY